MADLPTPDELAAVAQASLRASLDPAGLGTADLAPGSRLDAFVSVGAALWTRVGAYTADRAGAARLASATGEDLTQIARDFFNEDRKPAVAATGRKRFVRGAGLPATTIPAGTRIAVPATGTQAAIVYEVAETVAVGANAQTVDVDIRCTETGPRGNLRAPSAITAILDPLPTTSPASTWTLADSPDLELDPGGTLKIQIGGGAAVEGDDGLKARLGQYDPASARVRGTRDALLAGALRVPGVRWVTLVEPGDGTAVVYAGDANYLLPPALKAAIEAELLAWRCFGVPALVRPYAVSRVFVTATIHMARALAQYDLGAVRAAAVAAVKDYFDARPRPDEYFLNAIEAALFRADDEVQQVVLASPGANVVRAGDAGYSALTSTTRYVVDDATISVTIAAPLHDLTEPHDCAVSRHAAA